MDYIGIKKANKKLKNRYLVSIFIFSFIFAFVFCCGLVIEYHLFVSYLTRNSKTCFVLLYIVPCFTLVFSLPIVLNAKVLALFKDIPNIFDKKILVATCKVINFIKFNESILLTYIEIDGKKYELKLSKKCDLKEGNSYCFTFLPNSLLAEVINLL